MINEKLLGKMIVLPVISALFFTVSSCSNEKSAKPGKETHSLVNTIQTSDEMNKIISSNKKMLVFDFYADWCMPCKVLEPTFGSLSEAYKDRAVFYRVNIDRNPDIASAFGVVGIPLVVFMKNQKAIHAITGLNPKESYEKVLNNCADVTSEQSCAQLLD